MERTVADMLRTGADRIEQHGWWRGAPHRGGRECLMTSICGEIKAKNDMYLYNDTCYYMLRFLALDEGEKDNLAHWNDAQTDASVVIIAMRDAAFAWEVENGMSDTKADYNEQVDVPAYAHV